MTKQDKAKVIRAAEHVISQDMLGCCMALELAGASNLFDKFDDFCKPRDMGRVYWFNDCGNLDQQDLARTLALLMFAESE